MEKTYLGTVDVVDVLVYSCQEREL